MATLTHRPDFAPLPRNNVQNVARFVGWVMLVIGVLGFAAPLLMGMHLGFIHSMVYIIAGAVALWYGQNASERKTVRFNMVTGALFAIAGIAGLVFGKYGFPSLGNVVNPVEDPFLLELIPGWLEFGRADHIVHLVLGTTLLLSAVLWEGHSQSRSLHPLRR